MGLDNALRSELLEARERIRAQLDEIEFRANGKGFARPGRGGPPDYRDVYAELQNELGEIDGLLEGDDEDRQAGRS